MLRLLLFIAIAVCSAVTAFPAAAHPHVFVTVKSRIVYGDGAPKAVQHAWRFDDMFSAFAVQGLDTDTDGNLSRAELQALAEVNVTSLKEFSFFTFGESGGAETKFSDPVDYWLDYDGTALTLNFTLPVTSAQRADTFRLEIYDPSYFVSFALADHAPAAVEGQADGCRVDAEEPDDTPEKMSEDFFSSEDALLEGWGKKFANVMVVRCGQDAVAYAASIAPPPPPPSEPAPEEPNAVEAVTRVEQAITIAEAAPLQEMQTTKDDGPPPLSPALGPLGVVKPDGTFTQTNPVFAWISRQQASFYSQMSTALQASKADGSAFLLLIALSFAYGIFHAAGPGHGKAVISSYLLATGETLRRGIAISFASALAQAVTAVTVVGVFAAVLGATSQAMGVATWWLEAGSYVLIVLLGIGLLFRRSLIPLRDDHGHDEHCGHHHVPRLEDLDGDFGWRRAGAAILAVGLRPCTGALIILVFALAQGLVWTGIVATFAMAVGTAITVAAIATFAVLAKNAALQLASGSSPTRSRRALRFIEIAAGFAVLAFGLMLLGGMLSAGLPAA